MDANEKEIASDKEKIEKALRELGEHFETVHIFATRSDTDGAMQYSSGRGNFFGRYGQIKMFCIREEEAERVSSRKLNDE